MSKSNDTQDRIAAALERIATTLEARSAPVGHNDDAIRAAKAPVLKPSANEVSLSTPPAVKADLTYEANIKPLAQKVLQIKGREALLQLLEGFQVKSATKLNADQFDRFIEVAEKVLT